MKRYGIFFKLFAYTTLFLAVVIAISIGLFYQQFVAFYEAQQMQRLRRDYSILYEKLLIADRMEMTEVARRFAEGNQTFVFRIMDGEDNMLFGTAGFAVDVTSEFPAEEGALFVNMGGYTLIAHDHMPRPEGRSLRDTVMLAIGLIMVIALGGAAIFAKQMTRPIKALVADTKKMANLLPIESPKMRNDEIGDLSVDVHNMYDKLKDTIVMLEEENIRRKEMEESQRYFFSAASHELKTPIAATRVVLEGMLAGVGDFNNHPKYLRECIKLMDAQSKTLYEILDIVKLDGHYSPTFETINLKSIVSEQVECHKTLAQTRELNMMIDIPDDLHCRADVPLLKKALSNVILNAVQNTPQAEEISITAKDMADGVRLSILNTGHIDEEILPRLFEPFYRMDKARSRKQGRTGLGLAIVKRSLDIMSIDFGLENAKDQVEFRMVLPKAE